MTECESKKLKALSLTVLAKIGCHYDKLEKHQDDESIPAEVRMCIMFCMGEVLRNKDELLMLVESDATVN